MTSKRRNWFMVRLAAVLLGAVLTAAQGWAQNTFEVPGGAPAVPSTVPGPAPTTSLPTPTPAPTPTPTPAATDPGAALPPPAAGPAGAAALAPALGESPPAISQPPARPAGPSRRVTIHLGSQRFTYAEGGQVVRAGPVSTGRRGYGTPTGSYQVLGKQRHKFSSRYAGSDGRPASMPYAIQFRSNYFLHQGRLPGYPASHGCVRLTGADAQFLFSRLRPGDPVLITR